ncbi:MAG: hypothetical protein K0R20_736 [Actinomycetia bacterium]|nr:hypothetical protein [Actinomycetes bacterium]
MVRLGIHGIQLFTRGYAGDTIRRATGCEPLATEPAVREVSGVKRERIEKPKPRQPRELEMILPLDPRDPDVVRAKKGWVWRYADRRWAA